MLYKRIICLFFLLLGLSGCGLQTPDTPTNEVPPQKVTAPSAKPVDFEYAGLVLPLDSRFREGQRDQLWRMHYESDTVSVTVSHCLQDPMDSEARAYNLQYELEEQWDTVTMETGEEGFTYLICQNSAGKAYVCGQHDYQNLGWLVEVTGTAEVDTMVKLLTGCRPASGSLEVLEAQTVSLGALQLPLDRSFRQTTERNDFSCWVGAPYLLTVKRWQPVYDTTVEELAQEASEQQAYDREAVGIHNWGDVHCMSALGGEEPNIAVAYYMEDGYCYEVTLTGFAEDEAEAAVDLVGGGNMQHPEQTEAEVHTLTVDAQSFQDLCSYIEDFGLADEWGNYRIRITGLCTDVVLEMSYLDVITAEAYGRTLEVNIETDEGLMDAAVNQYKDLILLTSSYTSWIIGPDWEYTFPTDDGVCTYIYVDEAGQLSYIRQGAYSYYSELSPTGLLDSVSDRGALYFEEGIVTIKDQTPFLEATQRQTVSDVCDLDALFTAAKVLGWGDYDAFDSADDVLAENERQGIWHPSYPVEPAETAMSAEFHGLTLELRDSFEAEQAPEALYLNSETAAITVTTGSVEAGYADLEGPVTVSQLLQYELQQYPEGGIGSYKGIDCLVSSGTVIVFYSDGTQWWRVEATGYNEADLITNAANGETD